MDPTTARYRTRAKALTAGALVAAERLYAELAEDDPDEFVRLSWAIVAGTASRQTVLADSYLASTVTRATGRPTGLLGIVVDLDEDRATGGLRLSTTTNYSTARRIVANETMEAGRAALRQGMTERPEVVGWRRATDGSPCPLCSTLANGAILPPEATLISHPGCSCTAQPVTRQETP